ncbi:MAG: hypothetical protein SWY16_16655 [Cyanobacteriota bacterium]|nr:hypothetical protein [Cyanobacteriota bacterium]
MQKDIVETNTTETTSPTPIDPPKPEPIPPDDREYIKVVLIGSPQAVTDTIQVLYARGFAQVWEWSPPQPTQNPPEVMCLLRRLVRLPSTP